MLKLQGKIYKPKHNLETFFLLSLYFSEITSIILLVKCVKRYILAVKNFCCFRKVS
jgi:hypothetical protein